MALDKLQLNSMQQKLFFILSGKQWKTPVFSTQRDDSCLKTMIENRANYHEETFICMRFKSASKPYLYLVFIVLNKHHKKVWKNTEKNELCLRSDKIIKMYKKRNQERRKWLLLLQAIDDFFLSSRTYSGVQSNHHHSSKRNELEFKAILIRYRILKVGHKKFNLIP